MKKFIIALLPLEETYQKLFCQIAKSFFEPYQNGYLLTDGALAHITLCQFRAENEKTAFDAFSSFSEKQDEKLSLQQFHMREGTQEHKGFLWAEFLIEKNESLLEIQRMCFMHLAAKGHKVLTPIENYPPHITLARMLHQPNILPIINDIPNKNSLSFRPAIGRATENGVFIQKL